MIYQMISVTQPYLLQLFGEHVFCTSMLMVFSWFLTGQHVYSRALFCSPDVFYAAKFPSVHCRLFGFPRTEWEPGHNPICYTLILVEPKSPLHFPSRPRLFHKLQMLSVSFITMMSSQQDQQSNGQHFLNTDSPVNKEFNEWMLSCWFWSFGLTFIFIADIF